MIPAVFDDRRYSSSYIPVFSTRGPDDYCCDLLHCTICICREFEAWLGDILGYEDLHTNRDWRELLRQLGVDRQCHALSGREGFTLIDKRKNVNQWVLAKTRRSEK